MSGMKDKASGDYAPSRAPYFDIGRFRFTIGLIPGKVWIRDMRTGEGGSFDEAKLEAALTEFWRKEF